MPFSIATNAKNYKVVYPAPFNPSGWKKCKKDFIEFVNHYNAQKLGQTFTSDEKAALQKLHDLWKRATTPENSQIEYYDEMDQFNEILNEKLKDDSEWKKYKATLDDWKMECLMDACEATQVKIYK